MADFLPQDILNGGGSLIQNIEQALPSTISSSVGNKAGQIGNNPIISKLQDITAAVGINGPNGSLIKQQSAFPYKKAVSFMLKDRRGNLLQPPVGNVEGFQPGYFFKMFVNPSNFTITEPPKTVVPIRTLGGWRVQYWYPEIGTIRADGVIGNMLERFNRDLKDSDAWRGFRKLISVYRTNGVRYGNFDKGLNRKLLQDSFAPIAVCIFDKNQYEGYFESLEYTEAEDTPHTIKYSLSFRFLNNVQLDDIPGITRESSVDASIFNAIVPQQAISNAVNSINF